jgi:hypothetical protein
MSVFGAMGRSGTYSNIATEEHKKSFRNALRMKLDEVSSNYKSNVTEEEHLANIKNLSDDLTARFCQWLHNGRFRLGIAQKALNLYLKYLWCAGFIQAPPHCPFDSIVIRYLHNCKDLKWTLIDNFENYKKLVNAARRKADGKSIAEWELEIWLNSVQSERERKGAKRINTEKGQVEKAGEPTFWGQQVPHAGVIPPACNVLTALQDYLHLGNLAALPPFKSQNIRDLQFHLVPQPDLSELLQNPGGNVSKRLLQNYKEQMGDEMEISMLPRPILDVFLVGWANRRGIRGITRIAAYLHAYGFGGTRNASQAAVQVGKTTGNLFGLIEDDGTPTALFEEYFNV